MPQYEFKNKEPAEVTEVSLRLSEYDQWKSNNPQWERYHSPTSAPKMVTGVRSTLSIAGKEWEDKLSAIKKGSGKDNTINV